LDYEASCLKSLNNQWALMHIFMTQDKDLTILMYLCTELRPS
jgi:hypothetical protein